MKQPKRCLDCPTMFVGHGLRVRCEPCAYAHSLKRQRERDAKRERKAPLRSGSGAWITAHHQSTELARQMDGRKAIHVEPTTSEIPNGRMERRRRSTGRPSHNA